MSKKKEPTFGGQKAIGTALAKGEDPNADLDISVGEYKTKAEAALALKIHGTNWSRIADVCGYSSPRRAQLAVERVLAASADSSDSRDTMRALQDRRYNRLLQSVMPKAIDPGTDDKPNPDHLAYNARALAILDRISKMWGLDEAIRVNVTPTDERISQVLDEIRAAGGIQQELEEADIMEAEVVNDQEMNRDESGSEESD